MSVGTRSGSIAYLGLLPSCLPLAALDPILEKCGLSAGITTPASTLVNLARDGDDIIFTLCPAEMNGMVNGAVEYGDIRFEVKGSKEALALRINQKTRKIVSHALFGDAEIQVEQ
jgi:hypothetical protein